MGLEATSQLTRDQWLRKEADELLSGQQVAALGCRIALEPVRLNQGIIPYNNMDRKRRVFGASGVHSSVDFPLGIPRNVLSPLFLVL